MGILGIVRISQGGPELSGGTEPLLSVFCHGLHDRIGQGGGKARAQGGQRLWGITKDGGHDLIGVFPVEGQAAAETLVQDDADGVDVGSMIDIRTPFDLFQTHVRWRSHHRTGCREPGIPVEGELRDAEVQEFDAVAPEREAMHEDIVRLQITMHDALVVGCLQCVEHLSHQGECQIGSQGAPLLRDQVCQGPPVEKFHGDVVVSVRRVSVVQDIDDSRVADGCGSLGLVEHACHGLWIGVGKVGMKDFDGHFFVDTGMFRKIDRAHAARTNEFQQVIAVQSLTQEVWLSHGLLRVSAAGFGFKRLVFVLAQSRPKCPACLDG